MYQNIKYYVITHKNGKDIVFKLHQKFIYNNIMYVFLGAFNDEKDVPNVTCAYVLWPTKEFKLKYVKYGSRPSKDLELIKMPVVRYSDADSKPLEIVINQDDDQLMVMVKELFLIRKYTVEYFRELFCEKYDPKGFENHKSLIERKNNLSWDKFKLFIDLLHFEEELVVVDNRENSGKSITYEDDIDNNKLSIITSPEDDQLMKLMKSLVLKRNVSVKKFKELFNNKYDPKGFENHKSLIEKKTNLSWDKFNLFLELFEFEVRILIHDKKI